MRSITQKITLLVLASSVLCAGTLFAADYKVEDLAWMAGTWRGAVGTHGSVEENWNRPLGGSMTGTARVLSAMRVQFYELLVIEMTDDGPMLRMKHFSATLPTGRI